MKVKEEIEKYASALDRPILEWLFARYHLESKWRFVAKGTFYKYGTQSYEFRRIWSPTVEGYALYNYVHIVNSVGIRQLACYHDHSVNANKDGLADTVIRSGK